MAEYFDVTSCFDWRKGCHTEEPKEYSGLLCLCHFAWYWPYAYAVAGFWLWLSLPPSPDAVHYPSSSRWCRTPEGIWRFFEAQIAYHQHNICCMYFCPICHVAFA